MNHRGFLARRRVKLLKRQLYYARKLQAVWRGRYTRIVQIVIRARKLNAINLIQRFYRGYRGRKVAKELFIQRFRPRVLWQRLEAQCPSERLDKLLERSKLANKGVVHITRKLSLVNADFAKLFTAKVVVGDLGDATISASMREIGLVVAKSDVTESVWLYNGCINKEGVMHLAEAVKSNGRITSLGLVGSKVCEVGCETLSIHLPQSNIRLLHLESNSIGDAGIKCLGKALSVMASLQKLVLSNNGITDVGAVHIAEAFESLHNLEYLNLNNNHIGDIGVTSICTRLTTHCNNQKLTTLFLKGNKMIGDEGIQGLARYYKDSNALCEIDVSDNCVTDCGARVLAAAIEDVTSKSLNRKVKLWIGFNIISDGGAMDLLRVQEMRPSQVELQIEGNQVAENLLVKWDYDHFFGPHAPSSIVQGLEAKRRWMEEYIPERTGPLPSKINRDQRARKTIALQRRRRNRFRHLTTV
jgi:hypothetical protein